MQCKNYYFGIQKGLYSIEQATKGEYKPSIYPKIYKILKIILVVFFVIIIIASYFIRATGFFIETPLGLFLSGVTTNGGDSSSGSSGDSFFGGGGGFGGGGASGGW